MPKKYVFISGSSRGIGLEIAKKLSSDGFYPILHGSKSSEEVLKNRCHEIEHSSYRTFDLDENPEFLIREIIEDCGGLFGLVNNAGILAESSFLEGTYENFEKIFRINTLSHFMFAREFMNQKSLTEGRIVNISSNAIKYGCGRNGSIQYTATKLALEALTDGLSKLGANQRVLVNTIRPGLVQTSQQQGRDNFSERLNMIPLKRMAEPREIAEMVSFLMSEKASHITGQTIAIAGGE